MMYTSTVVTHTSTHGICVKTTISILENAEGRTLPRGERTSSALRDLNGMHMRLYWIHPPITPQCDIEACADF